MEGSRSLGFRLGFCLRPLVRVVQGLAERVHSILRAPDSVYYKLQSVQKLRRHPFKRPRNELIAPRDRHPLLSSCPLCSGWRGPAAQVSTRMADFSRLARRTDLAPCPTTHFHCKWAEQCLRQSILIRNRVSSNVLTSQNVCKNACVTV